MNKKQKDLQKRIDEANKRLVANNNELGLILFPYIDRTVNSDQAKVKWLDNPKVKK